MAQGTEGFKLITVNQDDDDVVIQAGILEEADNASEVCDEPSFAEDVAEEYVDIDGEGEFDECEDELEEECQEDDESDWDVPVTAPVAPKRGKWDGYETTAEDLVGTPMPAAQKATIVATLALLVLAIGYCVFFM